MKITCSSEFSILSFIVSCNTLIDFFLPLTFDTGINLPSLSTSKIGLIPRKVPTAATVPDTLPPL